LQNNQLRNLSCFQLHVCPSQHPPTGQTLHSARAHRCGARSTQDLIVMLEEAGYECLPKMTAFGTDCHCTYLLLLPPMVGTTSVQGILQDKGDVCTMQASFDRNIRGTSHQGSTRQAPSCHLESVRCSGFNSGWWCSRHARLYPTCFGLTPAHVCLRRIY
jgi:hypothetical protein